MYICLDSPEAVGKSFRRESRVIFLKSMRYSSGNFKGDKIIWTDKT